MTPLARLRRLWLDVHLWLGAGLLVVLIPISVTGSILVWHDEIDRALYAERYATTGPTASRPVADYAQAAEAVFAGRATLTQIRFPQTPGDPVVAVGRLHGPPHPSGRPRTMNAWIDPPTARVLGSGQIAQNVTMVLHVVHGTLMVPQVGRKIVGWLGWALFISCATGLWLWWPRRGGLLTGLRWRRGASTLFNLHHVVGFWVCVPLAVLSLTGVYISFPQTARALFVQPSPPANWVGRFAPPIPASKLSLTEAVAAAQAEAPGATLTEVGAPVQGREPAWRIGLRAPGAERPRTLQVVDATGEVKTARAGPATRGDPLARLMRQVHDGVDTGIVWRSVIFLAGLAPAILGVTGVVMWLRRRRRRLALRPSQTAA